MGKITWDEFLRSSNVVEKITNYDFKWFLKNARDFMPVEDVGSLISSGLFDLHYDQIDIQVEDQDDHKSDKKYKAEVYGGGTDATISRVGEIILDLFGNKEPSK